MTHLVFVIVFQLLLLLLLQNLACAIEAVLDHLNESATQKKTPIVRLDTIIS
jgi:hypothetical protein